MQNNNRNTIIGVVLCMLVLLAWQPVVNYFWPPSKLLKDPSTLVTGAVTGGGLLADGDKGYVERRAAATKAAKAALAEKKEKEKEKEAKQQAAAAVVGPKDQPLELIPLGFKDGSHLHVLLNNYGASVQRVVLTQFDEADRIGLRVTGPNGAGKPLPLVPGVKWTRTPELGKQRNVGKPDLEPGVYPPNDPRRATLDHPSYVMYHYDKPGDDRPVDTLGTRAWKVIERDLRPDAERQKVVFETELGEPHHVRIRKTYTLARDEDHVGMRIEITPLPGHSPKMALRYQLEGAHGLPIEGEWYTSTYHVAITGLENANGTGNPSRNYEDAREVQHTGGGERVARTGDRMIRYAATAVQYFASALVVDDEQPDGKQNFLEFVRSTPYGGHDPNFSFLDDVTVRAITGELQFDKPVTHQYLLYQGPVKVRLLRYLEGSKAVPDALVDRYVDTLHLGTLTDAPMPNALGRFANSIYWTDLVIAFTNLIHRLLHVLSEIVPNLGICVLLVTLIVRGMMFPISRRQALHSQQLQQKMAKLSPELKKIQEKYAGDFQRMMQERNKLYMQHGVNPMSALGGCLPVLIQMPIFMGLYYALQESVFFRLEPFLWMPNLAAPDMLVWWGENVPIISTPGDMGSGLYLGPYLNILPIIAIVLMMYSQSKMMPPSDDPQVQQQQKMMKWMMVLFGLFFYKVAAGLCLYFIASTLWGILERRYLPKVHKPGDPNAPPPPDGTSQFAQLKPKEPDEGNGEPAGWWGRTKARWKDRWEEVLEQAQKQQSHRNEPRPDVPEPPGPRPGGGGGGGKKKKKKR